MADAHAGNGTLGAALEVILAAAQVRGVVARFAASGVHGQSRGAGPRGQAAAKRTCAAGERLFVQLDDDTDLSRIGS